MRTGVLLTRANKLLILQRWGWRRGRGVADAGGTLPPPPPHQVRGRHSAPPPQRGRKGSGGMGFGGTLTPALSQRERGWDGRGRVGLGVQGLLDALLAFSSGGVAEGLGCGEAGVVGLVSVEELLDGEEDADGGVFGQADDLVVGEFRAEGVVKPVLQLRNRDVGDLDADSTSLKRLGDGDGTEIGADEASAEHVSRGRYLRRTSRLAMGRAAVSNSVNCDTY